MKILGIIVEYNPFHSGHLYHLNEAKKITNSDYVIAVMSGNYVQRGEPACLDKFTRAKMALSAGVDLVIELPTIYSSSSAEFFSEGAVKILDSLNLIECICFGAETSDIKRMNELSEILLNEPEDFTDKLKSALAEGKSYPKARATALAEYEDILSSPNNILGLEYIKALKKIKSKITPYIIERKCVGHDSEVIYDNITSATNIRKMIHSNEIEKLETVVPTDILEIIKEQKSFNKLDNFSHILQYKLKTMTKSELSEIFGMKEGIEHRLIACANEAYLIREILEKLKTKRYPNTSLQRLILHTILGIKKIDIKNIYETEDLYARVLGFRKKSENLLKILNKNSRIPVITNINDYLKNGNNEDIMYSLHKEIMWTDIYNIAVNKTISNTELTTKIIVV